MLRIKTIINKLRHRRDIHQVSPRKGTRGLYSLFLVIALTAIISCVREPELHLYRSMKAMLEFPEVELDLNVLWDYEIAFGVRYEWEAEWHYGWDEKDYLDHQSPVGYTEPTEFILRRYYTGDIPYASHTVAPPNDPPIVGTHFQGEYEWGYWDILIWNNTVSPDGIVSLHFDETTTLDSVKAFTNPSMIPSRYHAPKYTRAFYEPEALFSAYDQAMEVNRDLEGFVYDAERNVWVKHQNDTLRPITYIYLLELIVHNNKGRISQELGTGQISGFARSTNVNTGKAGTEAVSVPFDVRMKKNLPLLGYYPENPKVPDANTKYADVLGGRVMTFGICDIAANKITDVSQVHDPFRHYMDMDVQFNNGMDSTLVFDVTDLVRRLYKCGVIKVELDMDTVPIPTRPGGSGFNAVVKDFEDGGTWEFDM